jgi:myo-inositol 2-dehydrogenase/D-chiro-inositol 1-dehydrogenase
MSDHKRSSRRDFLKSSSAAVAGATLATGLSIARSAHAAGPEQIRVALIGCGGRGNGAIENCLNAGDNVRVVALADAFEHRVRSSLETFKGHDRFDVPQERVFVGFDAYRQAIDCGVEMVILATPPGFRPLHYQAAIEAGKHVFMEKPCCVDAAGFRSLMETNKLADQKGLKVGVGLQRHHQGTYIEGIKRIHDGELGKLMFLRAYWWNGGAIWIRDREGLARMLNRQPTEMEYQMHNWYHFCWLSGDHIVEQHVHNLDVCNWAMTQDPAQPAHPVEAFGLGSRRKPYPAKAVGQIFDHHAVEFTYADGTKMFSECCQIDGCQSNVSEAAHGSKGSSDCQARARRDNPYDQEHVDLLGAILGDTKYNEGWLGATSSMTAVLGRMATYSGEVVRWDDAVAKGPSMMPEHYAWDADPPVLPDKDGDYPMPDPVSYRPY